MRRKDREVTDINEIAAILDRCDVIRLGFGGGEPYVAPLSFGWELEEGVISVYFHGALEGRKAELLKSRQKICAEADIFHEYASTAHGVTARYESVIGSGFAEELEGGEAARALDIMMAHCGVTGYSGADCAALGVTRVYRLRLEEIAGKRNI